MAHSRLIAEKWGLYENALFHTKCAGLFWDEDAGVWNVTSEQGDNFTARFIVMNFGTLTGETALPPSFCSY